MGANLSTEGSPRHFDMGRSIDTHTHHANNISGDSGYHSSRLTLSETDKAGQIDGNEMQVVEKNNMLHEGDGTVKIDGECKWTRRASSDVPNLTDTSAASHRNVEHALNRLMKATNNRLLLYKGPSAPPSAEVAVAKTEEATMFGSGQGVMQGKMLSSNISGD